MPIDAMTPRSPGWWLARLLKKLGERRDGYETLDSYYRGDAAVPVLATKAIRQAYQRLMSMARTNYAELIVEAPRARMVPLGFRTGASDDELGDAEAWRIWQANSLDADSALVHRAMLSMADGYVIVGQVDKEIDAPLITPEDPREVITEHDPVRKRKVIAALKVFRDDVQGADLAYLYLPGLVYRAARKAAGDTPAGQIPVDTLDVNGWEWQEVQKLPAPVVPVVRFGNRMTLAGGSVGEFEPHIPLLDRINYGILGRVEIATMQAFRQRAAKGLAERDGQGELIDYNDIFSADPGALWRLPDTAEIWESGQVDLTAHLEAHKSDVRDLAAVTGTPMYVFTPDAVTGSAEGAALSREQLVQKTKDRLVQAGEPWEQVMSLAFTFAGEPERAARKDMEIIWASPELHSLAERADAAVKAKASGVPLRTIWRTIWQFSPQEMARMEAEQAAGLLDAALVAPPGPTPVVVPENAPV